MVAVLRTRVLTCLCVALCAVGAAADDRPPVATPGLNGASGTAPTAAPANRVFARSNRLARGMMTTGPRSQAHLQAGGDRLVELQNDDGGWDWPLDDGDPSSPSPPNTVGPIAMGLAKAYRVTGDADMYAALGTSGGFLLSKTNNFSPSDGYLAAELDDLFGAMTYVTHVRDHFYGPLAGGTYDRGGAGTLYDTAGYIQLIHDARHGGPYGNLAAWDIGMGLVGAASAGVTGSELDVWIAGVKAEIDLLQAGEYFDVIGLAGAVYALAFVGEDFDPTGGSYASASSLRDLADALASYQIMPSGGFTWNATLVTPGEETTQETAYATLALFQMGGYIDAVHLAVDYLKSVQLGTGGWENYVGDGENNEVSGEALWAIWTGTFTNRLVLEVTGDCPEEAEPGIPRHQIAVELWMRDLIQPVTGFTAWLEFDDTKLEFASGTYTDAPFSGHQPPSIAPGTPPDPENRIELGSYADLPGGDTETSDDALLATLLFTAVDECEATDVRLLATVGAFPSELSYQGMPVSTTLVDTPVFGLDDTPPVITCPPDVVTSADAGLCTATVSITPATATDNCDPAPVIEGTRSDALPLTDPYPSGTTAVTWVATDACGRWSSCVQSITVNPVNDVVVTVDLFGVNADDWPSGPLMRCIKFVAGHDVSGDCAAPVSLEVEFTNPGGGVAIGSAVVEVGCGEWTHVCAKDEQHTLYGTQPLTVADGQYELVDPVGSPLLLAPGDTDNDSDVDIHDVTWLMFQWGSSPMAGPAAPGGCPWDGTRDGDFDNNNVFTSNDYLLLSGQWHQWTTCPCTALSGGDAAPVHRQLSVRTSTLSAEVAGAVDFNQDGVVNYLDVQAFETANGLPHVLSTQMRSSPSTGWSKQRKVAPKGH